MTPNLWYRPDPRRSNFIWFWSPD